MALATRLRLLVAALVMLVALAVVLLAAGAGSGAKREAAAQPTAVATPPAIAPTPLPTPVVAQDILSAQANAYAIGVQGPEDGDLIVLQTLVMQGATQGHVLFWHANNELKMQLLPTIARSTSTRGGFQYPNSIIRYGVQQIGAGARELGIVYSGCCPASGFVLLRLEGDTWRIVWDVADHVPDWRGGGGQIEFPDGDLSEVIVRGDLISTVLLAGRPGYLHFVDTWVREGDGYLLQSAETAPTPYATLVAFIAALRASDEEGASKLVADKALVEQGRQLGLGGKSEDTAGVLSVVCDNDVECGKTAPIVFNIGPSIAVPFVERNGQWLISDITQPR